jgi:hypothetical protein
MILQLNGIPIEVAQFKKTIVKRTVILLDELPDAFKLLLYPLRHFKHPSGGNFYQFQKTHQPQNPDADTRGKHPSS